MNYTINEIKEIISNPAQNTRAIDIITPFGRKLHRKLTYIEDLDNFLKKIFENPEYNYLNIKFYRKNGSSWKELATIQVDRQQTATETQAPIQQTEQIPFMQGMNFGMNDPISIVKIATFDEVKQEAKKFKEKYENLKEKFDDLKFKLRAFELEQNKKSFWESDAFKSIAETIPDLVGEVKKKANETAIGLNQPQLSQVKQNLINAIQQNDDNAAQFILNIIELLSVNQQFVNEVTELMKKYQTNEQGTN